MIADIEREAELQRLARVLGVGPEALALLADAEPEDLRTLSITIADHLHERHAGAFDTAVTIAGKLPAGLTAKLAQHAMGPSLSASIAGLLEPKQAADLARRLPPLFLADLAAHVDLRRVGPLLSGIDPVVLAETGQELRRREEWVVLGTFVGHVDRDVLPELLEGFDAEALLRAGFFVEDTGRFDSIVRSLSTTRLDELLAAAAEHGLWIQAIGMCAHLGSRQLDRFAKAMERMPAEVADSLEAAADADPALREAADEVRARASAG
jgi:hypothetical protein